MKLPHVIVLSIIGMLVTSLSVLVFTARRQVPPQDALTSNESEAVVEPSTSPVPRPKLTLTTEPNATSSNVVPWTNSSQNARSDTETKQESRGWLQLTKVSEPCSFTMCGRDEPCVGDFRLLSRHAEPETLTICKRANGFSVLSL